ncbi:hypothetical protein OOT00_01560 [Desulfobotulus sp. H1]|uniref:Uncharacterized protein n=1 Tax=Desulfobotulus pelophilus TaxID=2823377 RepID=A0ABT3N5E8_9BACT|nr:hypothetical protein [Desulfobotulus pelophilus]MCW7752669.1 hypothetical protein [Desulfobotulus pelophilus]
MKKTLFLFEKIFVYQAFIFLKLVGFGRGIAIAIVLWTDKQAVWFLVSPLVVYTGTRLLMCRCTHK